MKRSRWVRPDVQRERFWSPPLCRRCGAAWRIARAQVDAAPRLAGDGDSHFAQAFATNVWRLFILRAIMGLTSGYIPNAMALGSLTGYRVSEAAGRSARFPRPRSAGVVGGPLLGGFLADHVGLRAVLSLPRSC